MEDPVLNSDHGTFVVGVREYYSPLPAAPVAKVKNYFNHPNSRYQKLYLELDALEPAETWIVDATNITGKQLLNICITYRQKTYRVIRGHLIPGSNPSKALFVRLL